jgi:hypothetical protein
MSLKDLTKTLKEKYPLADSDSFDFEKINAALAIQILGTDLHSDLRGAASGNKAEIQLTSGGSIPEGLSPVDDFFPTILRPKVLPERRHLKIPCRIWGECLSSSNKKWIIDVLDVFRGKPLNNNENPRLLLKGVEALHKETKEGDWLIFVHREGVSAYEAFGLKKGDWINSSKKTKEMFYDSSRSPLVSYSPDDLCDYWSSEHLEKEYEVLVEDDVIGQFVYKTISHLYSNDSLGEFQKTFIKNKDERYTSIKFKETKLISIFQTASTTLDKRALTVADKLRWFEKCIFTLESENYYLSKEWTEGRGTDLDLDSFIVLIKAIYPDYEILKINGKYLLRRVKTQPATNAIYFGPPGTGKSDAIKKQIQGSEYFRTLFHPEYTNADFVGSYRPVVGYENDPLNMVLGHEGEQLSRPINYFAFVPGPFTRALVKALNCKTSVFLLIEEINRGDCAAIFGDIFQLLDRDDAGRSEYGIEPSPELASYLKTNNVNCDIARDGKLYLPGNLSLLATMNTSDQSLLPMDSAFKRRWQWKSVSIDYDQLIKYTESIRPFLFDGKSRWDWIETLHEINKNIVLDKMEDKQIGPWFIKPSKDGAVSWDAFLNKALFYLWHDVFKDNQSTSESPFLTDNYKTFGDVQRNIRDNGLAAGFKPEFLKPLKEVS